MENMENTENIPDLVFQTHYYLEDSFYGDHSKKFFEIFPNTPNYKWDFTILSCFLNELTTFAPNTNKPYSTDVSTLPTTGITYIFSFIDTITPIPHDTETSLQNQDQTEITNSKTFANAKKKDDDIRNVQIEVRICSSSITVVASIQSIKLFFTKQNSTFLSKLRKWGKIRSKAVLQSHTYFVLQFKSIKSGTYALFYHKPMIFCSILDFSAIFIYFCKTSQKVCLPKNHDTFIINEFISLFLPQKVESLNSLAKLKQKMNGFLFLDIQKSKIKKKLVKYSKEENSYIVGGIYVADYAKYLFNEHSKLINGLLLDTS